MNATGWMEIFEAVMIIAFGASWPMNIRKAYLARTAKGTSLGFLTLIDFGYAAGIISKMIRLYAFGDFSWTTWLAFAFYILNFCMVSVSVALYFRNAKLDRSVENH